MSNEQQRKNACQRAARYRKTAKFKTSLAKWKAAGGSEYQRKWAAAKRASQPNTIRPLHDSYVRDTLAKRSFLHRSEIPAELVELQKTHLRLKRDLKQPK